MNIKEGISKVVNKQDLTKEEMADIMNEIMAGTTTSAQKGGFLIGLKEKGETPEELLGAAKALRSHTLKIDIKDNNYTSYYSLKFCSYSLQSFSSSL